MPGRGRGDTDTGRSWEVNSGDKTAGNSSCQSREKPSVCGSSRRCLGLEGGKGRRRKEVTSTREKRGHRRKEMAAVQESKGQAKRRIQEDKKQQPVGGFRVRS